MRRLAHISDLHFGAHEPAAVTALAAALDRLRPDLVAVSGDLTQRARRRQFAEADAFLRGLEAAGLRVLVVPGNHDVPWHRPAARLLRPLGRYHHTVARGRPSFHADAELAVLGLSSAHGLTVKDGRLSRAQVRRIATAFAGAAPGALRVLVTHHPLLPYPGEEPGEIEPALRGAADALSAMRAADVGVVLTGHHHAHAVTLAGPAAAIDPGVMLVQAGTATSWRRRRGEPNGFNLLDFDGTHLRVAEWAADGGAFAEARTAVFRRERPGGWRPADPQ